jgi:hypothetical protein
LATWPQPTRRCYGPGVSRTGRLSSTLLIAIVALVASGAAQAKLTNHRIVLGKSIGDISVGMTRAQVEQRLGNGVVFGHMGVRVEDWHKLGLSFFFRGSGPTAKNFGGVTNNPAYHTPQGIRFGSRTAGVLAAYGSGHCVASGDSSPDHPYKECTRHGPSGRVTIFYFDGVGEVDRIALGADSIASSP